MTLAVLVPDEPRLRPTRKPMAIYPPSDLRGRWMRQDQGYQGGAPIVALLLAWIDAVSSHEDPVAVLAALETADLREEARAQGWFTEAARLLSEEAAPELRAAFAREDCLEIVLGYMDVELGWHVGLAGLTYHEYVVTTLSLKGEEAWEIARNEEMLSRRRRRMGETLAVKTIDNLMALSAGKLRSLFRPNSNEH